MGCSGFVSPPVKAPGCPWFVLSATVLCNAADKTFSLLLPILTGLSTDFGRGDASENCTKDDALFSAIRASGIGFGLAEIVAPEAAN